MTSDRESIEDLLPELEIDGPLEARYNIAPSQPVPTVLNSDSNKLTYTQWGLIPSWAKDPTIGTRMINARSETIAEKPAYRAPFKRRRCLILADGFFEWQKAPGSTSKTPIYFTMQSGKPFAFAGLWDIWTDPEGGELWTSTIITTRPNKLVAKAHDRMPAILPPASFKDWLDPGERKPDTLKSLLQPFPEEEMDCWEVSKAVNSPRKDTPECIAPTKPDEHMKQQTLF